MKPGGKRRIVIPPELGPPVSVSYAAGILFCWLNPFPLPSFFQFTMFFSCSLFLCVKVNSWDVGFGSTF